MHGLALYSSRFLQVTSDRPLLIPETNPPVSLQPVEGLCAAWEYRGYWNVPSRVLALLFEDEAAHFPGAGCAVDGKSRNFRRCTHGLVAQAASYAIGVTLREPTVDDAEVELPLVLHEFAHLGVVQGLGGHVRIHDARFQTIITESPRYGIAVQGGEFQLVPQSHSQAVHVV